MDPKTARLTEAYNAAVEEVEKFSAEYDGLADDADAETIKASKEALDGALALADSAKEELDSHKAVVAAREKHSKLAIAKDDPKPAPAGLPSKVDEPDMYTKESASFIRDLFLAKVKGDGLAQERINRHQAYEVEKYAVATGTLGGVIPPQYLVDLYAKAQRFGRVLADQCDRQELPEQGMSLIVPRLTAGLAAGIQASESTAVSTQDPTETDLTVNVRTIAGYSPVSRQTLERAAYSEAILFEDLLARYNASLDTQLISGSGASGQHLGILNVSGISTATVSSWTVSNFVNALYGETGVIAAINSWAATTGTPADKIFMHPRRWGAIASLLDSQNRPLFAVDALPAINVVGEGEAAGYGMVGHIAGLPVFIDANIPTNLGAGTNEDRILVMSSPVVHLWERGGDPVTLSFEQQAGTSLQVQLVAYGYSAFTAGRYPAATGVISGAGLT